MQFAVTYAVYGQRADGSRCLLAERISTIAEAMRLPRMLDGVDYPSFVIRNSFSKDESHSRHDSDCAIDGRSSQIGRASSLAFTHVMD